MKSLRYFVLGPLIIALAFNLTDPWLCGLQVFAGVVYIGIGILMIVLERRTPPGSGSGGV